MIRKIKNKEIYTNELYNNYKEVKDNFYNEKYNKMNIFKYFIR